MAAPATPAPPPPLTPPPLWPHLLQLHGLPPPLHPLTDTAAIMAAPAAAAWRRRPRPTRLPPWPAQSGRKRALAGAC
eukprot:176220-Chlamydomonas_euryale.AAC.4